MENENNFDMDNVSEDEALANQEKNKKNKKKKKALIIILSIIGAILLLGIVALFCLNQKVVTKVYGITVVC